MNTCVPKGHCNISLVSGFTLLEQHVCIHKLKAAEKF